MPTAADVNAVLVVDPVRPAAAPDALAAVRAAGPANVIVVAPAGHEDPAPTKAVPPGTGRAGSFRAGLKKALDSDLSWFWLVDAATVPEPGALAPLLAAAELPPPLDAPLVLASKVVDEDGELAAERLPYPDHFAPDVRAVLEHGFVQLRAAEHGSLLVHRRGVRRVGRPSRRYTGGRDGTEWTARQLRGWELGFWVPESVAVRRGPAPLDDPAARRAERRDRARLLTGRAFGPEKLWIGYGLLQDALRDARRDGAS